jgi:hypothetical protein
MGEMNWRPAMASIYIVIVGFLYFGIIRGRKIVFFEGRVNSWKTMTKKQGANFYRNGQPVDLKISDFWRVLHPPPPLLDYASERWVYWSGRLRGVTSSCLEDFSSFFPPPSLPCWSFFTSR